MLSDVPLAVVSLLDVIVRTMKLKMMMMPWPNPTWRIRGGKLRKGLKIRARLSQVFTTGPVWPVALHP